MEASGKREAREAQFLRGLLRVSASCRQEVDDLTLEVYTEALCHQTAPEEWEAFTREAVATGRFTWFPKVAELLDALREFRVAPSLDAEAVEAYDRVLGAGVYRPEGGTSWSFRAVAEQCGAAAAAAFLEAGGHNAFASTFRESDRRERFIAAYRSEARARPESRLLPSAPIRGLLPGDLNASGRESTKAEALEILERLSGINAAEREPFTKPPRLVEASDERLDVLRRQAQEIQSTEVA